MEPLTYDGIRMSQKEGDAEHGGTECTGVLQRGRSGACLTVCFPQRCWRVPQNQISLLKARRKERLPFVSDHLSGSQEALPLGQSEGIPRINHCYLCCVDKKEFYRKSLHRVISS